MLKNFLKNSSWVLGANIGTKLISFVLLAVLARLLNASEFAFYFLVLSVAGSINQISDFGMSISVHQKTASLLGRNEHQKIGGIFSTSIVIILSVQIIFSTIILIFPQSAYNLLFNGKGEYTYFLLILPISLLTIFSEFPLRIIMGLSVFKWISLRNLLIGFFSALIVIVITIIGGVKGTIIGQIIALILSAIYSIHLLKRSAQLFNFSFRQTFVSFKKNLKILFNTGFIMYLGNTFVPAIANFYIIALITQYLPEEQFGYIRIGGALATLINFIPLAIQPVTLSYLAQYEKYIDKSIRLKNLQIRHIIGVTTIIGLIFVCLLPILILLLFGSQYLGGLDFIVVIIIINIGIVIPYGLFSNFLMASGKGWYIGVSTAISTFCMTMAYHTFIPMFLNNGYLLGFFTNYFINYIILSIPILVAFTYKERKRLTFFLIANWCFIFSFSFIYLTVSNIYVKSFIGFFIIISYVIYYYFRIVDKSEKDKIKVILIPKILNFIKIG